MVTEMDLPFPASDGAAYIIGRSIAVDGGTTIAASIGRNAGDKKRGILIKPEENDEHVE